MAEEIITKSGPLFEPGLADHLIRRWLDGEVAETAHEGERLVRNELSIHLQHPTGHYEAQIQHRVTGELHAQVDDDGVVYGPWLEGTSSRNQTTRFKGYASFRKAAQELDARTERRLPVKAETLIRELS